MSKTVRDLKNQILREAGCKTHFEWTQSRDESRMRFWDRLNKLGWEKRSKEPEQCGDIDATANLSDDEYEVLLDQARSLV